MRPARRSGCRWASSSDIRIEPAAGAARSHTLSFFGGSLREEQEAVEASEHLVTFLLADEEYGVDVKLVQEIIRVSAITPVPRAPEYIRGVINLRGNIFPVFDMQMKVGMNHRDLTDEARIVVISWNEIQFGILVDSVREVCTIYDSQIEQAGQISSSMDKKYLLGVAKHSDGRLIVLLDLPVLFDIEEILEEAKTAVAGS